LTQKFYRWVAFILMLFLTGCAAVTSASSAGVHTSTPQATDQPQMTATPGMNAADIHFYYSPEVPQAIRAQVKLPAGVTVVDDPAKANVTYGLTQNGAGETQWVYALVASFPTVQDDVAATDLQAAWQGTGNASEPLLMTSETAALLTTSWENPAGKNVQELPDDQLLTTAWDKQSSWAIVPFDELQPRWKVLSIDGATPLDRNMDLATYPLVMNFGLSGDSTAIQTLESFSKNGTFYLPATNRDLSKLTIMILTGTTALTRETAVVMDQKGVLYPASDIGDLLHSADITHVSNEVPFMQNCPPTDPNGMKFCSKSDYMQLLLDIHANVIELTGNHEMDYGADAMRYTLQLYRDNHLSYYGGGENQADAEKPLYIDDHGNHLAFIGCNSIGPETDFATQDQPGALRCDRDWLKTQIAAVKATGYLPIVTFQSMETCDFTPSDVETGDMQAAAADGAVIVSGSQAHCPQAMTFEGDTFIHYGLGNLFFDQDDMLSDKAFIDRHYIYDGRYISTQLFTIKLEDHAKPVFMTQDERESLLSQIFAASEWQ
jgi:poly-gamma-glutamate synthesis protein (capsule biosynthesis protein)